MTSTREDTHPTPRQVAELLGCTYDHRLIRRRRAARAAARQTAMAHLDQISADRAALLVALDERWLDDVRAAGEVSAR